MTSNEAQLAAWLQRLVALRQAGGGALAQQLVAAVAGRGALLVLDDARLALDASVGEAGTLELRIVAAESERPATCATTGETLRAIVDGRRLLEAAELFQIRVRRLRGTLVCRRNHFATWFGIEASFCH